MQPNSEPQSTASPPAEPSPKEVAAPADEVAPPSPDAVEVAEPVEARADDFDLDSPEWYLNRELTWLAFNARVLHEAQDTRNPLMERVKFLAIVGMTVDEFFMKRIGGLKLQVAAEVMDRSVDGRTAREQIAECHAVLRAAELDRLLLLDELVESLKAEGISLLEYRALSAEDQHWMRGWYIDNAFPLVTPQAMDPAHPFPFVSNLSLNLLVTLTHPDEESELLARVKVPVGKGAQRLVRLRDQNVYVPLEEVMAHNLDLLFPGMVVLSCEVFRVTRNANTEVDRDQADDLLATIESELVERKFAPIVRLEVRREMIPRHRGMLAAELGLQEDDVWESRGMVGLADLMELFDPSRPELCFKPHHPVDHPAFTAAGSVFHIIRNEGPMLVHRPYQSFISSIVRFLTEAASDPKVRAIKMTLYRTSEDARVIMPLIDAARNGKQVAVVVELQARFDEAANIRWASRLEAVGIHVSYGVVGLKSHCKLVLVVRQDYDGLRRYCHIGTGNYHAGTARLYTDLGLFTCDHEIGRDVTEVFNYLTTGYKPKRDYQSLLVAPKLLKPGLLAMIDREIELQGDGDMGLIQMKANALEDVDVTRALYRASQAGVRVDLIIRDSCRLRPGIVGLSENVRVISIVGRFLEHARIFHFRNGGDDRWYIGSADVMKRNLESRVEVLTPVDDEGLKAQLQEVMETQLTDTRGAWEMSSDGTYHKVPASDPEASSAQDQMVELAERAHKEATRLKRRRPRGPSRRGR